MNNDVMSHEQAISKQAAERYVLAQLSQEEREAFEGHYFDCPACFEQIKLGAEFLRHTRDVLDPEPEKGWLARTLGDLWRPAPAFVSAMMLLAVGGGVYQGAQLAQERKPHVVVGSFLPGAVKGLEKSVAVSRTSPLSLEVSVKPGDSFTAYQGRIVSELGQTVYTFPVSIPADKYSVWVGLRADSLKAGKYSVVIEGIGHDGSASEVGRGSLNLQFTD
jgi:hypothetical protein